MRCRARRKVATTLCQFSSTGFPHPWLKRRGNFISVLVRTVKMFVLVIFRFLEVQQQSAHRWKIPGFSVNHYIRIFIGLTYSQGLAHSSAQYALTTHALPRKLYVPRVRGTACLVIWRRGSLGISHEWRQNIIPTMGAGSQVEYNRITFLRLSIWMGCRRRAARKRHHVLKTLMGLHGFRIGYEK